MPPNPPNPPNTGANPRYSKPICPPRAASRLLNSHITNPRTRPKHLPTTSTHLATPSQPYHPPKTATLCGHPLHPSASPKTRLCTRCIMSTALRLHNIARARFDALGGLHLPPSWRNLTWNRARLALVQRIRSYLVAEHRRFAREEAEKRWEGVHAAWLLQEGLETGCEACKALEGERGDMSWILGFLEAARGAGPWWEKANAIPNSSISTSLSRDRAREIQNRRVAAVGLPAVCQRKSGPKGSSVMREIRRQAEFEMALKRVRQRRSERAGSAREIEAMLRRKHNLPKTMRLRKATFTTPYAEHCARKSFVWSQEEKLRARGGMRVRAWQRKPSPLWCVLSIEDVEDDPDTVMGEQGAEDEEGFEGAMEENPWEFIDLLYIVG
ncbi:hypothetical protein BU16DRAFT_532529 [Lophium mytilinum]|uniref:Uncharacterized protein n=1 Tax=Lophium mytilinum TaxID=390894 RepID=A0A6A6REG7_9PEZI|nr:hypothetical protein BU16DRAFT_532529 [Lophium mytilinum]